ncbi:MAG: 16S rRNA (cytosine(1402)-N(4))-methyltransferase, partial [Candidatus Omnitrophota bacterium]
MVVSELCIKEGAKENMVEEYHYPVMHREVLEHLDVKNKGIVVDCTVGVGSQAFKFLEQMESGTLIGIDKDNSSLEIAGRKLAVFKGRFTLVKDDFINLDKILKSLGILKVDAFLFDLGISTYQLNNPKRGFSFSKEGPLDMR